MIHWRKLISKGVSMGTRAKRYQGGAIISFIVVTVVIAALLVGGIFWLRQRSETARQGGDVATNQQDQDGGEADDGLFPASNSDSESNDASRRSDNDTSRNESDSSGSGAAGQDSGGNGQSSQPGASSSTDTTEELPETGPAETVGMLLAIGALSYAGVRYVTSRRDLIGRR